MFMCAVQAPEPETRQNGKMRTSAFAFIVFFAQRVAIKYPAISPTFRALQAGLSDGRNCYPRVTAGKALGLT